MPPGAERLKAAPKVEFKALVSEIEQWAVGSMVTVAMTPLAAGQKAGTLTVEIEEREPTDEPGWVLVRGSVRAARVLAS